ncbi:superoxide dismutase, Cu-Zn family [Enterovibrio nigricans DSM 22720]|uniref:Superoxide dismutase [Cu-Zn] n=2 Tax=Enterovibrio nigricans TaxID=504469 RepID=A0A1T4V9S9_9GAMM|nr:superoxide dismutase, Cu-Zn family [Enterovibrio nigricans DSM 22720]
MMKKTPLFAALTLMAFNAFAETTTVEMVDLVSGKVVGVVEVSESKYGTVFSPSLEMLPPGMHGFHLHSNGSCESSLKNGKVVLGGAAGGHYDPEHTGQHGFPWTDGNHLGDLPGLYVDSNGKADVPVLAPRVKLSDINGKAIMIHAGGDNHSDHPAKLGGGGSRIVCGVVK